MPVTAAPWFRQQHRAQGTLSFGSGSGGVGLRGDGALCRCLDETIRERGVRTSDVRAKTSVGRDRGGLSRRAMVRRNRGVVVVVTRRRDGGSGVGWWSLSCGAADLRHELSLGGLHRGLGLVTVSHSLSRF